MERADGPSPIFLTGEQLLLAIDLTETAACRVARGGSKPQRNFNTDHVRRVIAMHIGCNAETFDLPWLDQVGMPKIFDFLRTNKEAIFSAFGTFDAENFLEVQMGFQNRRKDTSRRDSTFVYHRLFQLIAASELTEKDFLTP